MKKLKLKNLKHKFLKYLKRWLLPIFALLLTGIGAMLPAGAAAMQDAYVENRTETRELNPVKLTLVQNTGVGDVLALMSETYSGAGGPHAMPWAGETRMTRDEAILAAEEFLTELLAYGLGGMEPKYLNTVFEPYAAPMMMVSGDGDISAILWECDWSRLRETVYDKTKGNMSAAGAPPGPSSVFIDDATGKMIHFFAANNQYNSYSSAYDFNSGDPVRDKENTALAAADAEFWREFLEDYYGLEILYARDEYAYDMGVNFWLMFDLGEELGERELLLNLDRDFVGFN